jgi:translation initiation factor 1
MRDSKKVYSTDLGKLCPECENPIKDCACSKLKFFEGDKDGIVRISRETKGRSGKGVTLITGLKGTEEEIKTTAKLLKQKCNCGGTVKNGVIEIQGDQRAVIKEFLENLNYSVKLAGG